MNFSQTDKLWQRTKETYKAITSWAPWSSNQKEQKLKYRIKEDLSVSEFEDQVDKIYNKFETSLPRVFSEVFDEVKEKWIQIGQKKQKFEEEIKELLVNNPLDTELEQKVEEAHCKTKNELEEIYNQTDSVPGVFIEIFEVVKQEWIRMADEFKSNYTEIKTELCRLFGRSTGSYSEIKIIEDSFNEKLNEKIASSRLLEELKSQIRTKINKKKESFLSAFREQNRTEGILSGT